MTFEIRQLSWHKRRRPGEEPKLFAVDVPPILRKKPTTHVPN